MDSIRDINENYYSFTKSEKKVADYIINNSDKLIHNTMSDIKNLLNVGDATIIRFCKKAGFSGFTDLKISIAKDFKKSNIRSFENYSLLEDIENTLSNTYELIDSIELDKVITTIKEADNIIIFGRGQSGMAAMDLERILLSIGVNSTAIVDPDFQIYAATATTDKDLLIAFTLTGRTAEIINSIEIAKKNSAKIVSITNYLTSPAAELSDLVLQSSYNEFISTSIPGRISQMYLSGLIADGYEKKYQTEEILNLRENIIRKILEKRVDE